jgi:hypothetical protein
VPDRVTSSAVLDRGRPRVRRIGSSVLLLLALLLSVLVTPVPAAATETSWDTAMNTARADAGLAPVVARSDWTGPAQESSRYMVLNGLLTHDPVEGAAGYSEAAFWAANTGNLLAASWRMTPAEAIGRWLDSPGHAFWVLHPQLATAGFGEYHDAGASPYSYAATLPVIGGLDRNKTWPSRITYPADGARIDRQPKTVHVLGSSLPSGAYTATVTVDGHRVEVAAVTHRLGPQVAVQLAAPLPRNVNVIVDVRRDGAAFQSFAFSTGATGETAAAPPVGAGDAAVDETDAGEAPTCVGTEVASFPDVASSSAHAAAVGCAATLGFVGGYPDGSFQPARTITRAQAASALDRTLKASGMDLPAGPARFTDVGGVHADAIHRLAAAGVTAGREATTFDPTAEVTRAQLILLLDRATAELGTPLPEVDTQPFDDVGPTHAAAVARAHGVGIASGFGDRSFRPGDAVRRDHAASLLTRWVDWRVSVVG